MPSRGLAPRECRPGAGIRVRGSEPVRVVRRELLLTPCGGGGGRRLSPNAVAVTAVTAAGGCSHGCHGGCHDGTVVMAAELDDADGLCTENSSRNPAGVVCTLAPRARTTVPDTGAAACLRDLAAGGRAAPVRVSEGRHPFPKYPAFLSPVHALRVRSKTHFEAAFLSQWPGIRVRVAPVPGRASGFGVRVSRREGPGPRSA